MNAVRTCLTAAGTFWMGVLVTAVAEAAPVLITLDNYKAPVVPIVEDFDDGLINAPGLTVAAFYQIVAGGIGGGKAIETTTVVQDLAGLKNYTAFGFLFDEPWPTQVGFVTTHAAFPAESISIGVLSGVGAGFNAPYAPNRYFQVTDTTGIQAIEIGMQTPVPGEPFFQIDDLQYVPEPSGAALLVIGVAALLNLGCRGQRNFRWGFGDAGVYPGGGGLFSRDSHTFGGAKFLPPPPPNRLKWPLRGRVGGPVLTFPRDDSRGSVGGEDGR